MSERVYNALFVCNSARSILGEAILNHVGHGRFRAYSAGSALKGAVHPMTLDAVAKVEIPPVLRPTPWNGTTKSSEVA